MKKTLSFILTVIIALSFLFSFPVFAGAKEYTPDKEIYAKAYMLINLDDPSYTVVAQKNQNERLYPASLTKIVTAMVTLENVKDLNATTTMSQNAYDILINTGAQTAGLKVGESLTIEELLYLTMVHSACDACEILAEYVGGSVDGFVKMMNDWTKKVGCTGTNFVNPDGLHDDNHYTTASDMAKITLAALKNETFFKISTTTSYQYKKVTFYHTNLMLRSNYKSYYYAYAQGIKTGSTDEAGYCVITKASKDGYNYLAIVLGSPHIDYNKDGYVEKCSFIDAASLFDWAFTSLKYATLAQKNQIIDEVPVNNGKNKDSIQLVAKNDVSSIVPSSLDSSTTIIKPINKPESINAPVKKGDEVCKADIIYGGETIANVTLVAGEDVELSTFLKIINAVKAFFSLTVVQIILVAAVLFIAAYIYLVYYNAQKKKKRRAAKRRMYEQNDKGTDSRVRQRPDDIPPPRRRK